MKLFRVDTEDVWGDGREYVESVTVTKYVVYAENAEEAATKAKKALNKHQLSNVQEIRGFLRPEELLDQFGIRLVS